MTIQAHEMEIARAAANAGLNMDDFTVVSVTYMGTAHTEIGLAPRQVSCRGTRITADIHLIREETGQLRDGADECELINGSWVRYPD